MLYEVITQGIKFIGDKGWIEVARGYLACSDSSLVPEELAGARPGDLNAAEKAKKYKEMQKAQAQGKGSFEISSPHMQNFVDSVRSRQKPIAPIEVGASTACSSTAAECSSWLGEWVSYNFV